ncbi:MAG: uroporphyrinogen-III synthase [Methylovulum miyakonense]|uniref:uroporphyrinogen-III synthase n=1 Tax=Methylovulum miyakonense TaxID=645578 RepID=UPI003BB4FEDF
MTGLNGANILVTRPAHQAESLCRLIEGQGGNAVRFPTLEIVAVPGLGQVQNILANLGKFDWLIFISVNAVNFALKANGGKIPRLNSVRFAAVGLATAQALATAGLAVDLVPGQGYNSEALLASSVLQSVGGQHFLIVRGEGGREELATVLRGRGAEVDYLDVYRRVIPSADNAEVLGLITQHQLDAITVTSGDALQNLLMMVAPQYHSLLLAIPIVVVSGRIAQIAGHLGFKQIVVAAQPADTAIHEAVTMCLTGK